MQWLEEICQSYWGFSNQKGRKGKGGSSTQASSQSDLALDPAFDFPVIWQVRGGSLAVGRFGVDDDPAPISEKMRKGIR